MDDVERVARAIDPVGWDWFDRVEPDHIARAIFHERAIKQATAAIAAMERWLPIESAPRDGTVVDLWADGERWSDCFWGKPEHCCGEEGSYCDSEWHGEEDGWVSSFLNMRACPEPTHWRPLPAPPAAEAGVDGGGV